MALATGWAWRPPQPTPAMPMHRADEEDGVVGPSERLGEPLDRWFWSIGVSEMEMRCDAHSRRQYTAPDANPTPTQRQPPRHLRGRVHAANIECSHCTRHTH